MPQHPFSMQTIPPEPVTDDRTAAVRRVSSARHACLKEKVLADISRQFGPHRFNHKKGKSSPQPYAQSPG